jgi:hypothetical protein
MTDTPQPGAAPAAPEVKPYVITWPETRDVIALMSTALFAVAYAAPWLWGMPKGADQYVGQAQGALLVQWASIMSWYFGASKGSAAKDATIAAMAKDATS